MASQGFFDYGDNFGEQISGRFAGEKDNSDDQIASSLSSGGYGGYIDAGSRRGYVSPEQAERMLKNPEAYKMRPSETRYLRESMGLPRANFVSPRGNEVARFASVDSPRVQLASVKSYIPDVTRPYAPDDVGDYIKESDTRTQVEKDRDAVIKFFTKEEGGVFKNEDEFNRKMTTYGTDADGNPTATNAFGEKVNYDTDTIKRYIAADAKEKYQPKQEKKSIDEGLNKLQEMNQRIDDFNYYKRNLVFNEKGEADPTNKYVLTAPQMRERMKQLGPNETMDKYGIIRPVNTEREKTIFNNLQKEKENRNILQRVGDFLGSAFNTLTGTQAARGDVLDGRINFNDSLPSISTFSETGDPSFRSYRLGEDFSNLIRGVGDLPAQDTSFSSYVRGAQPGQERGNTRLQEARKIANRNPNVSINEKTGRAEATNNSGRARAQAMAVNRKLSGKSISQKKAENRQAMKNRAKARHAAFKKKRAEKKKKMKNKRKKK